MRLTRGVDDVGVVPNHLGGWRQLEVGSCPSSRPAYQSPVPTTPTQGVRLPHSGVCLSHSGDQTVVTNPAYVTNPPTISPVYLSHSGDQTVVTNINIERSVVCPLPEGLASLFGTTANTYNHTLCPPPGECLWDYCEHLQTQAPMHPRGA